MPLPSTVWNFPLNFNFYSLNIKSKRFAVGAEIKKLNVFTKAVFTDF